MTNIYWAIVRKSDNYILEIYGSADIFKLSDVKFMLKIRDIKLRKEFEIKKVKINLI